ncbi:MAG: 5-dehydro-2-deoxygluconokinase [Actinomycetota bacterium]
MGDIELLAMGRVSVDLYPEQIDRPLAQVSTFRSAIGGTATNVAVAAARLGHRAALVTKVGDDPFGGFVRAALERFGVDASYVSSHPDLPTPVVFAELDPPAEPSIWFYRRPSAPDEHLTVDDVDLDLVRSVPVLWIPGSRMAFEPSATTTRAVLAERARRSHTVLDLDYRPMFWSSAAEAGAAVGPLLDHVTVAVGNREECEVAVGTADPEQAAARMIDRGIELAIVKMGGDGVMAVSADGRSVVVPPTPVEVVCGLGAGDAFGGSLVHGLLTGAEPEQMMTEANAAGAIVASRLLCSDDMPTLDEIATMLATGVPPVRVEETP